MNKVESLARLLCLLKGEDGSNWMSHFSRAEFLWNWNQKSAPTDLELDLVSLVRKGYR